MRKGIVDSLWLNWFRPTFQLDQGFQASANWDQPIAKEKISSSCWHLK